MVQFEVLSDIGKKRTVNEDSAAVLHFQKELYLQSLQMEWVDTCGGDFASSTAIKIIGEEFMKLIDREI